MARGEERGEEQEEVLVLVAFESEDGFLVRVLLEDDEEATDSIKVDVASFDIVDRDVPTRE